MSRSPAARVLVASVLSAATLLTAAACSAGGTDRARSAPRSPASPVSPAAEQPPAAPATPAAPPVLTEEQARAALVTETDLGGPWVPTRGAATWRDGLLKATTGDADCRRLLDALYTDDLFGVPGGPRAVVALDDMDTDAQLRHQVTSHRAADLDRTLDWLKTLPEKCGSFTATPERGGAAEVVVTQVPLPEAGDARQGLRVTLTGTDADGEPAVLTLEVAAVRVGEDAISLTNGGLGEVVSDITRAVAELGARRLTDIRRQGRALV
ncbi:hypothetical protein [Streptomyces sp. DH24]|uniref:hypothetical protein n=1 Tax=Streptomyces sp. DH24 TaxID=3040123 RepID=UPI0024416B0A|nr:hypothetical protein [Streptomyces sp. DH24]MDG9718497.1 hypothetical protein [Streptomyces sp. DH24]